MLSKNMLKLQKFSRQPYFTPDDVAAALGVQIGSARVFCSRNAQQGLLIKLKNGYYADAQKWENNGREDLYRVANILQVPSYISFMTALAYYDITSQVQQDYVESACLKRSKTYSIKGTVFNYYKLKKEYYFDFVNLDGKFVATKEKAFLDSLYLYSFGKYRIDFSALDLNKLDKARLGKLLKIYPDKTRKIVRTLCRI